MIEALYSLNQACSVVWFIAVILLDWILIGALDGARLALEVDPLILFVDSQTINKDDNGIADEVPCQTFSMPDLLHGDTRNHRVINGEWQ